MNPITNVAILIVVGSVAGVAGYGKGYYAGKATRSRHGIRKRQSSMLLMPKAKRKRGNANRKCRQQQTNCERIKMRKSAILMLGLLPLLTACATGRSAPPKMVPCPIPPDLAVEQPARNWQGEMRSFLQGTVPMPPEQARHSNNASTSTTK